MPLPSILNRILRRTHRWLPNYFPALRGNVSQADNIHEVCKFYGWSELPLLDDPAIHGFAGELDLNERRIRDAEALGTVAKNSNPKICVDIGTCNGNSAALVAINAPQSHVYTINIPPEELLAGEGGEYTTGALEREQIGIYYRERGLKNITQLLVNTAKWVPDMEPIDLVFVDGCHDTEFVFNDTLKSLRNMREGSFILWHDFNPHLVDCYPWIAEVCRGVELLFRARLIEGRVFHLHNSWVGLYRVTARDVAAAKAYKSRK